MVGNINALMKFIVFQTSDIIHTCVILSPRQATGNGPVQGAGKIASRSGKAP